MKYKKDYLGVVSCCKYHVVWCTKYRRNVLTEGVNVRLKELIEKFCTEHNIDVIKIEIMSDYVYLLIEIGPQTAVHKVVKQLKRYTFHVLCRDFAWLRSRLPTLWTNSYFVSTAGGTPLSAIEKFVGSQPLYKRNHQ